MTNRAPNTIWMLRDPRGPDDQPNGYVRTTRDDCIEVHYDNGAAQSLHLNRADARLLARRINECLDKTAKGRKDALKRRSQELSSRPGQPAPPTAEPRPEADQ